MNLKSEQPEYYADAARIAVIRDYRIAELICEGVGPNPRFLAASISKMVFATAVHAVKRRRN